MLSVVCCVSSSIDHMTTEGNLNCIYIFLAEKNNKKLSFPQKCWQVALILQNLLLLKSCDSQPTANGYCFLEKVVQIVNINIKPNTTYKACLFLLSNQLKNRHLWTCFIECINYQFIFIGLNFVYAFELHLKRMYREW